MMARSRAVDRVRSQTAARSAVERLGYRDEARPGEDDGPSDAAVRRDEAAACWRRWRTCRPRSAMRSCWRSARGCRPRRSREASGVPLGTAKSRLRLGLQKARESLTAAA